MNPAPHLRTRLLGLWVLLAALTLAWPLQLFAEEESPLEHVTAISSGAAIIMDAETGRVLWSRNAHQRIAPASTTKMMTAIIALEHGHLSDAVVIAPSDPRPGSTMGVVPGETLTLEELLYGLMLPSGNDAATAIARYLGHQNEGEDPRLAVARFVGEMNARAEEMGLEGTHFVNPHGLDARNHYSTAYDLARIALAGMRVPFFAKLAGTTSHEVDGPPTRRLINSNKLLGAYPGADGVKVGFTDGCGRCLVASATRDGRRAVVVSIQSDNPASDSAVMLDYFFSLSPADIVNRDPRDDPAGYRGTPLRDYRGTPHPR